MSKSVASESTKHYIDREIVMNQVLKDEEKEDEEGIMDLPLAESLTISTVVSTVPAVVDDFMHTMEFKRIFVPFVHEQTLMALRVLNKEWNGVADVLIDERVASGAMIVHNGNDISDYECWTRSERRKLLTRVIFLLNITKVGERACFDADNLIVVDIPKGVKRISRRAFERCGSLTTAYFPTTLTSIGPVAFANCFGLDNVDLLHTNLQELGYGAFRKCSELKSMTIPDSLQTTGELVFLKCSKLVPSTIDVSSRTNGTTSEVITHLHSQQEQQPPPP